MSINQQPWVVIPTYDEKENITQMIPQLFALGIDNLHVLVVDDSSPDGTGNVVKDFQKKYPTLHLETRKKKSGLGQAYIHGFRFALDHGATSLVQMDADFSHDPKDVPRLLKELESHDAVIGSRYSNGVSVINWPLHRLILSTTANLYARYVTGMPHKDITGGFRAWRAACMRSIDLSRIKADGYGFQVVMIYRAWKKKHDISEIPIIFTERREGQSKMSKSIIWEAFWLVWKLRLFG